MRLWKIKGYIVKSVLLQIDKYDPLNTKVTMFSINYFKFVFAANILDLVFSFE